MLKVNYLAVFPLVFIYFLITSKLMIDFLFLKKVAYQWIFFQKNLKKKF